MKRLICFSLTAVFVCSLSTAHASLVNRGSGLIYDTDLNITWLQDANYAKTSGYSQANGYDSSGRLTWTNAKTWAENLNFAGYDDWRLPKTLENDPTCSWPLNSTQRYGYVCSKSEMGHLFYNEFSGVQNSFIGGADPDVGLFFGIQPAAYWSGTADTRTLNAPYGANGSWNFDFSRGFQNIYGQPYYFYAWAVRDGDSAAPLQPPSKVSEPSIIILVGLGLLSFSAIRRRKQPH